MTHKVIIEGVGKLAGNVLSGVALTPSVSLNRNIYSVEAIDDIKGLDMPLKADWEHTEEYVGSVVYTMGPNHSILYKLVVETDRILHIKEGVHKVSIEAEVDEVASSCNKKGCYNLLDGITLTGIGITENPGVQTTTLAITESFQSWPIIEGKHCPSCKSENSPCVTACVQSKIDNGRSADDVDIIPQCNAECGGNESTTVIIPGATVTTGMEESEEVKTEIENLKREIEILKMPHCTTCNKVKKI